MTFVLYAMVGLFGSIGNRDGMRTPAGASVRHPGDALQIDAFFVHLVERGQLAQALDLVDDEVGHVVDLLLGREAPEAEADARVRELVADSERAQDVARLEAGRRAGGAGAHRDVLDG